MIAQRILSMTLALVLLGFAPAMAIAQAPNIEELATGMANTPDEHRTVASYYRGKAEQARNEAAVHKRMSEAFGTGKYAEKKAMKEHCDGLIATFETQAKQYDALAADHDNIAKQAK